MTDRAPSGLTHLVAVSLLEHSTDITDSIARSCTRRSTGQRGLAVWRVSSVGHLMRRLGHLPDGSLEKLDIVGHGKPGHLFIGVGNAKEREGDPNACISATSARVLAAVRRKLAVSAASSSSSMLERTPRVRLVGCDVGRGEEGEKLVATLSELLGGVVVMAPTDKVGAYCPLMEVEDAD